MLKPLLYSMGLYDPNDASVGGGEDQTRSQVNNARKKTETVEPSEDITEEFGKVSIQFDLSAISLFIIAAATRLHNLSYPPNIVFDELHYGKYASLYLRGIFFFDPHPPLGKQLVSAAAAVFNPSYNGTFKFSKIGTPYPDYIPIFGMRLVAALCGSVLPPVSFMLCKEIGIAPMIAYLSGILIILDNALFIQSRYILMEAPLIAFGLCSLLFALKATKQQNSVKLLVSVTLSAFFGTCSLCVKYVGLFYLFSSFCIITCHWWEKYVPKRDISTARLLKKLFVTFGVALIVSCGTYISIFKIHLSVLTQAGPHDSVMTSAFQASLKGGLASIIKGQPIEVVHGSQVTLRNSLGRPCWLHSHNHKYPIKYTDGRGSSHQQQVTCYSFKDVNNWWIIKKPNIDSLVVNDTKEIIYDKDEINLIHGITGRLLNSHDVAAPVTPQNQEVSCYMDHNVSMPAEPLWRVHVIDGCGSEDKVSGKKCAWHAVRSNVRLIHVTSGQALRMSGKQLPSWGFNQHEVVTDRIVVQDETIWNVEEHRYTKGEKEREKELLEAEMIPTKPTDLSFWSKFWELQWKMLINSGSSSQSETHAYASYPSEWMFLSRGIAYWIGGRSNAQIHLLGNPILWFTTSFNLIVHCSILVFYLLRRRRECFDVNQDEWSNLVFQSSVCLGGYSVSYVYHFCVDRTLFLHHYLPSYVYKIILLDVTIHHVYSLLRRNKRARCAFVTGVLIWLGTVVYAFVKFLPLSLGYPSLSREELEGLKWRQDWDFIIQTEH